MTAAAILAAALLAAPAAPTGNPADPPNPAQYGSKESDARFLRMAYSGNMLEIKLSQFAVEQLAKHEDVKALARMLVTHHEEAKQAVEAAAQKSGVELPKDMLPAHKAKYDMATEVKGELYHVPYLFSLAGSHTVAILEVSHRLAYTKDAAVKAYCEMALPKLKEHLAKIKPMAEDEAKVTGGPQK